jgi:hypothetical protein
LRWLAVDFLDVCTEIHRASAPIAGDYSTIVEVTHDGAVTFAPSQQLQTASHNAFADCDLRELIELTCDLSKTQLADR